MAAAHPEVVERVVLLAPTAGPRVRNALAWLRVLPGPTGERTNATGRWRVRLLERAHERLGGDPPLRLLNVVEYACASLPRAVSTARCAVLEHLEDALPRIDVPVLIVRAEQDHLSSLDWAESLPSLTPDGRLVRLPGLGHAAFHGAPDAVADVVAPFLSAG
jgi:pimeloyl-ACP methyl ester carboxylesterase